MIPPRPAVLLCVLLLATLAAADPAHPLRQWVKRHPLPDAKGAPPPRMGYETSYGYDPVRRILIRHAGHNQGGGGEQNAEVWTYDLGKDVWELKQPNDAPPGTCCAQQNVFDESLGRFVRFPAFSGSHGWQSFREIYLKDSSIWTYDLPSNTWRAMRPCPEPWPRGLRGAAYDPQHQCIVIHGGETANHGTLVYDSYANNWHEMKPKPAPPVHSQPGFAYDEFNRVFVLFGSQFEKDARTWIYDLRKNAWSVLETPTHPPADKSSPILAADTRNGIVLCSVQGAQGLETWVLNVARKEWSRLNVPSEPEASGSRNRVLIYLADENLFLLENRTKNEQQILTLRYAEAPAAPPAPRDVRLSTTESRAKLAWKAPADAGQWQYKVYRAVADKPLWQAELLAVATVDATTWTDPNAPAFSACYYQVRAIDAAGNSSASQIVRSSPPVVDDLVVSVTDAKRVEISWKRPTQDAIMGYRVERAPVAVYSCDQLTRIKTRYRASTAEAVGRVRQIGAFEETTPLRLVPETQFVDQDIDLSAGQKLLDKPLLLDNPIHKDSFDAAGKPYAFATYAYRIITVNGAGIRGGPSPWKLTIPSAVQHVFAQEQGAEATRLKWAANPEKGLKGYLVYRHDSRWDKDTITLLTPAPIAATEFTDEASGKGTRRYEIVAVDALGQQGEPSQPVWSRREWARFYVPYVGPWHQ